MTDHNWNEGVWEPGASGKYERVDKCLTCGCYRVALKGKLTDTTSLIRYYPASWTGRAEDNSRCRQKPPCNEPIKEQANDLST